MKYRRNKVKREHGIIQDALTWLEDLSRSSEVTDIIPGVIEVSRSPERGIVYKYETHTGCKILLKSNGSIQEAFVVTKSPEFVRKWIEERFMVISDKASNKSVSSKGVKLNQGETSPRVKSGSKVSNSHSPIPKSSNSKFKRNRSKSPHLESVLDKKYLDLKDSDAPNLGQRMSSETRQALRALQKSLNPFDTQRKK